MSDCNVHAGQEAMQDETPTTFTCMRAARRWLVWRLIEKPDKPKPDKIPFYVSGRARRATDTPDDLAQLASFDEAFAACARGGYAGIAFALGPDGAGGHWQGIDLDDVPENLLADIANNLPGYVEKSPGGNGAHFIGYGAHFPALGSNGTGVEAYSNGRYFTVTGWILRDSALTDLSPWVAQWLVPRHTRLAEAAQAESGAGSVHVDAATVTELRSALAHLPADDRDLWVAVGQALKELGDTGFGLWWFWSQRSDKCKPEDAKKWDSFDGDRTGYQAVFSKAQAAGWINPGSKSAQTEQPVSQGSFTFKFARPGGTILQIDYLIDPWLPRATVIGCYGRGEAGKSSWTAQICAAASGQVSALWVSSEERQDHILQRHLSCGGQVDTLAVIEALPTKIDPATKKAVASNFNIYEHMESAIVAFQRDPQRRKDRPLGIVALDAVVALVTWGKGENANDDGGVKRLIAKLCALSEQYSVTFIILGHLNKGTSHDHIADAVTGAAAWTNSVRLAYMFAKDIESESYEGFIRTAKSNTGTHFGAIYRTKPVYVLRERPDGHHDVLCGAEMVSEIVWGEVGLREMMGNDDNDRWLNKREQKREQVQAIVDRTLQALRNGPTTRKAVEVLLGAEKVSRRYWQEADAILARNYGVQTRSNAHNVRIYFVAEPT